LRPYAGRVLIIAASKKVDEILHPKRGYPALISDLDTVIVEGGHKQIFKDMDPAAPSPLARALSAFLTRHD
jgi:thioesterase domain-containing protein